MENSYALEKLKFDLYTSLRSVSIVKIVALNAPKGEVVNSLSFELSSFKDWSRERKKINPTGAVYSIEMHHTLLDQWTVMVGIFYIEACNSPARRSYRCSRLGVFIFYVLHQESPKCPESKGQSITH